MLIDPYPHEDIVARVSQLAARTDPILRRLDRLLDDFEQGVIPLGGSWLTMAESRRALSGQHPTDTQHITTWLEQTVAGQNRNPTPFVWNGKRRRRRKRARLRRFGGSAASFVKGYAIAR